MGQGRPRAKRKEVYTPGSRSEGGGRKRRIPWLQPWPLLALPTGLLLGRATLLGYPGPFGLAWVAAMRSRGSSASWLAAAGVLLGLAGQIRKGGTGLHGVLPAMLQAGLGVALVLILTRVRAGTRPPGTVGAAVSAAGAAAVSGVLGATPGAIGGGWVGWVAPGLMATTTGVLAFIFSRGFRQLHENPAIGLWEGDGALAGLLLALGLVGGLQGMPAGPIDLAVLVAGMAVMAAGWAGGPLAGAAAGLLAGLAGMVAGPAGLQALETHAVAAVTFGAAGLLAGGFRELGRFGTALAYMLGYCVLSFAAGAPDQVNVAFVNALLSLVAFAAIPHRWVKGGRQWLAAGLPDLASLAPVSDAGPRSADLEPRMLAMAHVLRDVQRTMAGEWSLASDAPPPVPDALAPLIGEVQERVCHGCNLYARCWEQEFFRSYQIFSDVWGLVEEDGPLPSPAVPESLQRHCTYALEVMSAFNSIWDMRESEQRCEMQLAASRRQMGEQLQTVARMLELLAEETTAARAGTLAAVQPQCTLRVGTARMAKRGSIVCGDSFVAEPLAADRYLLVLSDGTGAGKDAALESQQAVRLLHGLLKAGYRLESAVQTVNSALLLRDATDRFPTLDVMWVDLASGRADLVKAGAAPTILKRGPHIQVVRGAAPPAGVMHPLPLEPEFRMLRVGDWVVMATDGLWDRGRKDMLDGGSWLQAYLSAVDATTPDLLAEAILGRALDAGEEEPADDMTVLVARVEAMGEEPLHTDHPPASASPGEPVPAMRAPAGVRTPKRRTSHE